MSLPLVPPVVRPEAAPFWDGAREGRLRLQRCLSCDAVVWYPRGLCPECHYTELAWFDSPGAGSIYSFAVVRKAFGPFAAATPYLLAYVELDEGPRLLTNLVDVDPDDAGIGQRVEVVFEPGDGFALPRFRPVRAEAA